MPSSDTIGFIGPTATVTIADGQRVHIVAHRFLGAYGTPATNLDLFTCYRQGQNPIATDFAGGMYEGSCPANMRLSWGISSVLALPAGTYTIGMCGRTSSPNWVNNDYGYMTYLILNN